MSISSSLVKASLPYAEALFESSQLTESVEKTNQGLLLVVETVSKSDFLRLFLSNPLVTIEIKKKVLQKLFLDQVSYQVLNFLFILIDRRRINLLNSIVDCYLSLVYKLQLTTVVHINTAILLTDLQMQSLQKKLQDMTNSKEIKLVIQVDPELIGGFVIKIGSKVIDMSIYGQLNQMTSYLNVASI